jgi:transcriptional regulator with XRE-family HTH domain
MNISIAENLKRLRITREVTQEALAEYVGVSAQSVSKWERGENFPDIALVPFIATFFDVTTDELLGMSAFRDEKRVEDVRARIDGIALDDSILNDEKQRLFRELWRELAHDMPNNDEVQLTYAGFAEDRREGIKIAENVLARSTDDNTRFKANRYLSDFARELGDIEKAREYANRLPSVASGSREVTLAQIAFDDIQAYIRAQGVKHKLGGALDDSEGKLDRAKIEELIAPYRDGIFAFAQQLNTMLLWNSRYFEQLLGLATEQEDLRLQDFQKTLAEMMYWQQPALNDMMCSHYFNVAVTYAGKGDAEKTLEALEKCADYAEKIDIGAMESVAGTFFEDGKEVNRHFEQNTRQALAERCEETFGEPDFYASLGINTHPRFIAAIKRIRGTE